MMDDDDGGDSFLQRQLAVMQKQLAKKNEELVDMERKLRDLEKSYHSSSSNNNNNNEDSDVDDTVILLEKKLEELAHENRKLKLSQQGANPDRNEVDKLKRLREDWVKEKQRLVQENQKLKCLHAEAVKEKELVLKENQAIRSELEECQARVDYLMLASHFNEAESVRNSIDEGDGRLSEQFFLETDSLEANSVGDLQKSFLVPLEKQSTISTKQETESMPHKRNMEKQEKRNVVMIQNTTSSYEIFQQMQGEGKAKEIERKMKLNCNKVVMRKPVEQVLFSPPEEPPSDWELELKAERTFKQYLLERPRKSSTSDLKLLGLWENLMISFRERESILKQLDAMPDHVRDQYLQEQIERFQTRKANFNLTPILAQVKLLEQLFEKEKLGQHELARNKSRHAESSLLRLLTERKRTERVVRSAVKKWEHKYRRKFMFRGIEYLILLNHRYDEKNVAKGVKN